MGWVIVTIIVTAILLLSGIEHIAKHLLDALNRIEYEIKLTNGGNVRPPKSLVSNTDPRYYGAERSSNTQCGDRKR